MPCHPAVAARVAQCLEKLLIVQAAHDPVVNPGSGQGNAPFPVIPVRE
jgi:hypothetical protein